MKKPTLADALAKKEPPAPPPAPPEQSAPLPDKPKEGRIATTLRIEPERLEALKILAARRRVRVNDLILEGVAHVLALYAAKP